MKTNKRKAPNLIAVFMVAVFVIIAIIGIVLIALAIGSQLGLSSLPILLI